MKKTNPKKGIPQLWVLLTTMLMLVLSCSKEDGVPGGGGNGAALVKVKLLGVEFDDISKRTGPEGSSNRVGQMQAVRLVKEIPFNKDYTLVATLTPTANTAGEGKGGDTPTKDVAVERNSIGDTKIAAARDNHIAALVRSPLDQGIAYRLLVYDADGVYVTEADYTAGGANPELQLDGGSTYTFVCYSIGGTGALPAVTIPESLSQAKLVGVGSNVDLMFYQGAVTLAEGSNDLDIVLKHKFSEITVAIDASDVGDITAISGVYINPHHETVDLNLANGSLDYQTAAEGGRAFSFPDGAATTKSSAPTLIATPSTTNGVLTIESITVSGDTKTNVQISELNIVPGQRYTLRLTLQEGELRFAPANLTYSAGSGWRFAANESDAGDYFQAVDLYPFTAGISEAGDPCAQVDDGYLWRTPTQEEVHRIIDQGFNKGTLNGRSGMWFPDINVGSFLPAAGIMRINGDDPGNIGDVETGYYYTSTFANQTESFTRYHVLLLSLFGTRNSAYSNLSSASYGAREAFALQIRCVRGR